VLCRAVVVVARRNERVYNFVGREMLRGSMAALAHPIFTAAETLQLIRDILAQQLATSPGPRQVGLPTCLSVCLFVVCLSVCWSLCLSVCLSFCLNIWAGTRHNRVGWCATGSADLPAEHLSRCTSPFHACLHVVTS